MKTKYAPAERLSSEEVHKQAELFLQLPYICEILNSLPNAVVALNNYRQIVYANNMLLNMLNLNSVEGVLGRRPGEVLHCIHAVESEGGCGTTDFCANCGAVNAILNSQTSGVDTQEFRLTLDEKLRAMDLKVMSTRLEKIQGEFTLFVVSDISHEKRREVLERIFFHDILNTAGNLRGFAQLLVESDIGELAKLHKNLYSLSDQLIEEIRTQQDLLKAEKDQLTIALGEINSLSVLEKVKELYQYHIIGNEKDIVFEADTVPVIFYSDKTLINRVLSNILKNALEATKKGSTITLGSEKIGELIEFRVHNPGYIDPQAQRQIFQRSFTTKGQGHGIGTYSMKLISEKYLKGEVGFRSTQEEGTTFFVRYPLQLNLAPQESAFI